jgi:hypothetical protein
MAVFTYDGQISFNNILLDDGTQIIPQTHINTDGINVYIFKDHIIPVYLLKNRIQSKALIGTYISYNITLICENKADTEYPLKIEINIPPEFKYIHSISHEGVYDPETEIWTVTLTNYTATLNFILKPTTPGICTQIIILQKEPTSSKNDTFHSERQAFEKLKINKGEIIPQYYTKKDKEYLPGPTAKAPYTKQPHTNYVLCDEPTELNTHYKTIQSKEGTSQTYPRLITFNSTESHPINMYWNCVKTLRQHLQPEIEIQTTPTSLNTLTPKETRYNTGDTINIRLPGRPLTITCRITKTIKNPKNTRTHTNNHNNIP